MAGCSVCGDEERLLNTCNRCGKKNCPEHQLPENHVCVPRKSEISDDGDSSSKWFSEKHERSNVMADERRGDREMVDDPDPHLEKTETKRPLDEDEIDADTESSPHDWVRDVQKNREALSDKTTDRTSSSGSSSYPHDAQSERRKNREAMNRRLSGNDSSSSDYDPSASTPPSPQTGGRNTGSSTDTPSRIPSALWIIVLLALLVVAYLGIGAL